ncbi:MAG: hypothetical protein H0W88_11335 [Parachlamydiaceae bacterium]|nr:hypothetical protein [Parachlamydiaceae bacterium]
MKLVVTKPQIVSVTVLTLVALAASILLSAHFGDFTMRPGDMEKTKSMHHHS